MVHWTSTFRKNNNSVFNELKKLDIPLERIDSKDIRDVIPDVGFSRDDRNRHMHRIGHLIKTLQNNSVSTVSPYRESIREMVKNNIVVYIKADIETCKQRDYKGVYEKALNGVYEEPKHAEIQLKFL